MIPWEEQTLLSDGIGVYESPSLFLGRVRRDHEALGYKWLATVQRTHVPSGVTHRVQFAMPVRRDVDQLIALWNGCKNPTMWKYELVEAVLMDSYHVVDDAGRLHGAYCYHSMARDVARRCNDESSPRRPFSVVAAPQPRLSSGTNHAKRELAHG